MKVSICLSIHNRSKLFGRALHSYLWQTLPPEEWELIVVDDLSTERLKDVYAPLIGKVNIRHVYFDHRRHDLWKRKNPDWTSGMNAIENWYHTPALTTNLGVSMARGSVIGLCHPEIIHGPDNFKVASEILNQATILPDPSPAFVFAPTYIGTAASNRWMDGENEGKADWHKLGFDDFIAGVGNTIECQFKSSELYWYCSFLPKAVIEKIGGVDFSYMDGVAAEDDDFRDRVVRAGCPAVMDGRLKAFHQYHGDEKEAHRQRDSQAWQEGLARNRAIYAHRRETNNYPARANEGLDWTAKQCVVEVVEYNVGCTVGGA